RGTAREARAAFEQAIGIIPHLPDEKVTRELAIDLRFEVQGPLFLLDQMERVQAYAREARVLAETLGDRARLAQALSDLAEVGLTTGDLTGALKMARKAQDLADRVADPALQVNMRLSLGFMLHALGQHQQSVEAFEEAVSRIDATGGPIGLARV